MSAVETCTYPSSRADSRRSRPRAFASPRRARLYWTKVWSVKKRTVSVCAAVRTRAVGAADCLHLGHVSRVALARQLERAAGPIVDWRVVRERTNAPSLTSTGGVGAIGSKTPGPGVGWT